NISSPVTLEDAGMLDAEHGSVAFVGMCGEWAFALEPWSAEGIDEDVIDAVTSGTETVVLFSSSTAPSLFTYVKDGTVVSEFEMHSVNSTSVSGTDPELLIPGMKSVGILLPDGEAGEPEN